MELTREDFEIILDKKFERFEAKYHFQDFATKDDLQQCASKDDLKQFATKDDLHQFATKDDLKQFATKDDLLIVEQRLGGRLSSEVGRLEAEIEHLAMMTAEGFVDLQKRLDVREIVERHERLIVKIFQKVDVPLET